ncbi:DEAD/DEAH box helicase family protein [Streptomonospora alba]|uniref:hypothetical protein n=1 Tax=Streptomonospora alba TaxID=183763 RepID=UPI00069B2F72|nr:hypothetical protein [Streptomonospora alba]
MRLSSSDPAAEHYPGGAPAIGEAAGSPRGPTGTAAAADPAVPSAGWSPLERLPELLAYYRRCLWRESVLGGGCRLAPQPGPGTPEGATVPGEAGPSGAVCLPGGPEPLFSGAEEAPRLPAAAGPMVRTAEGRERALRYGYPLVVLESRPHGHGPTARVAPLLVADVETVDAADGPRVRAVSGADLNPVLLRALGVDSAEEVAELRRWLRRGSPSSGRAEAGMCAAAVPRDLEQTVRTLLVRLGIERADPILPSRLRDLLPEGGSAPGARNVAVVYPAGDTVDAAAPAGHTGGGEAPLGGLIAELASEAAGGLRLDVGAAASTALGALLGAAARPGDRTAVPVCTAPLDESGHRVLQAALRDPLTVAAAPPGTGGAELVDAVVRTAAAAGLRVVVGGKDDGVLDRIARRAGDPPGHTIMRAGGAEHRAAEARLLERVRDRAGPGSDTATATGVAALQADTAGAWARVEDLRHRLDRIAAAGRDLASLARERRGLVDFGWRPERLFGGGRGGPEHWIDRAERALAGGLSGVKHRSAVRRELGVDPSPENLRRLCWAARVERDWRAALDRRHSAAPLDRLVWDLDAALQRHRASAAALADSAAEQRLARGRSAVRNRLESLNWYGNRCASAVAAVGAAAIAEAVDTAGAADADAGTARQEGERSGSGTGGTVPAACPGFGRLLTAFPAWAVSTRSTRSLPGEAGLFDLAVVVDADQLSVPELLPLLYRAKQALIIGDPARPAPWSALEPAEDDRLQREAGLSPARLDRRALAFTRDSAYDAGAAAASAAGRPPLWLEEHRRCRPEIAGVAARHCYGGRIGVLSRPGVQSRGGSAAEAPVRADSVPGRSGGASRNGDTAHGGAVEWRHGMGECEPIPGGAALNRAESHRAAFAVQEADALLRAGARLGVFAPVQPQRALLRRLLDRQRLRREVGVYGPADLLDDEDDAVDTLVVSAVCSGALLPDVLLERVRAAGTWSGALGRTVERLIVVGDRAFWRGESGPLAELARSLEAGSEPVPATAAFETLCRVLRESGARVQPGPYLYGYRADLRVATSCGPLLVLVDHARTGAELRRLAERAELLADASGERVARVPAWRCLHEPEVVAGEIAEGTLRAPR